MIDYATLLKKYIAYIADCEGIDYIEPIDLRDSSDVIFTDAEWPAMPAMPAEQAQGWCAGLDAAVRPAHCSCRGVACSLFGAVISNLHAA